MWPVRIAMLVAPRLRMVAGAMALAVACGMAPAAMAARWTRPAAIPGVRVLRAVSCVSRSFCVAVGGGQAVVYASGRWRTPRSIDSHESALKGLATVSCVSATFCLAGDRVGNTFVYDGTRWSSPMPLTSAALIQLSCGARTFCGALDSNNDVFYFDGSNWSQPQLVAQGYGAEAISCPVVGFCMAMLFNDAYRWSGGRWRNAGSVRTSEPSGGSEEDQASAVSCSGPRFCAALDDFGDAFTWTADRGWSARHRFDSGLAAQNDAVSCPSKRACMVVDIDGFATSWNGTRWSRKRQIDRRRGALIDVSCPVARFCMAVDARASALIYN